MLTLRRFPVVATLTISALFSLDVHAEEEKHSLLVEATAPKQVFSEQRPEYLHIKNVLVTREGTQRLEFEVTLLGKMPINPKESVSIYFGFDIDKDSSTGSVTAQSSNFGQDVGFFIYQNQGDSKFRVTNNSVDFKGRQRDINVSKFKVDGDKISVSVRSELFSMFDSFKFFVSVSQRVFEKGKMVNETQISTTPVTVF